MHYRKSQVYSDLFQRDLENLKKNLPLAPLEDSDTEKLLSNAATCTTGECFIYLIDYLKAERFVVESTQQNGGSLNIVDGVFKFPEKTGANLGNIFVNSCENIDSYPLQYILDRTQTINPTLVVEAFLTAMQNGIPDNVSILLESSKTLPPILASQDIRNYVTYPKPGRTYAKNFILMKDLEDNLPSKTLQSRKTKI